MKSQQSVDCQGAAAAIAAIAAMKQKASKQLQKNSYHNGTLLVPNSSQSIFASSHIPLKPMHAPLNPPSDPTLLAFRIPKHFRESEMNNNNNNPPSEYLHNTHMRGYEIKSEGLLNIHPRLSKKRVLPIYTFYCLQEKPRIPACGVVLYMEVGSHQMNEKRKEKRKEKEKISFRSYTGYTK